MHTHTLLIADASKTTQRVIQLTLANESIRVVVASDGHEALARIEADRPDMILASTSLPGVDGFAIASHVSQTRRLRVPVFLLRGGFEPDDEAKVKESGASGVLGKPLDPGLISHCVKQALSVQAPVDERASEPKQKKVRTSSVRPRPERRRSALPVAKKRVAKGTVKSASRPRPSARRTPRLKAPVGFESAYAPMFAALNNHPGAAAAMTPEMLAKTVSDAVGQAVGQALAHAITQVMAAYQQANGQVPQPSVQANLETAAISAANDFRARPAEGPVVVHGDMGVLTQLRRDMGIDDFLFGAVVAGAGPGIPACAPFDAVASTQQTAVSPAASSLDAIRSAAVSDRDPADVLGAWSDELQWLAAEIGHVRVPEAVTPEWSRDSWTGADTISPRALPARLGAWLAACDIRPTVASFAAATTAWLRAGTPQLFEPLRGGEVRVRTWVIWIAGASAVLKSLGKG